MVRGRAGPGGDLSTPGSAHSHSIVAGGFDEMS